MQQAQPLIKDPDILGGAAVFQGTRGPFQALLDYLEGSETLDEFLDDFPTISRKSALRALDLASSLLVGRTEKRALTITD